jgi:hypothetical protein
MRAPARRRGAQRATLRGRRPAAAPSAPIRRGARAPAAAARCTADARSTARNGNRPTTCRAQGRAPCSCRRPACAGVMLESRCSDRPATGKTAMGTETPAGRRALAQAARRPGEPLLVLQAHTDAGRPGAGRQAFHAHGGRGRSSLSAAMRRSGAPWPHAAGRRGRRRPPRPPLAGRPPPRRRRRALPGTRLCWRRAAARCSGEARCSCGATGLGQQLRASRGAAAAGDL